jgi:hypothetical protein
MAVTVTNEQVLNFRRNQEVYMRGHSAQFRPFLYALSKMYQKTKSIEDDILEREREIEVQYCTKDKDGYAVMDKSIVKTRGLNGETREEEVSKLKFSADNLLASGKEKKALLQKTVEIEPHITTDIPDDFDFNWWRVFSPFVLPEDPDKEILDILYERSKKSEK